MRLKCNNLRKLTLDERLAFFDPKIHGYESMQTKSIGLEKFFVCPTSSGLNCHQLYVIYLAQADRYGVCYEAP